ncbi:MAG: lysophospholipase [Geminicoccaceae bacterium]
MIRAWCLWATLVCMLGLAACASGAGPANVAAMMDDAGMSAPWRHWQPPIDAEPARSGSDRSAQLAASGPEAVILALHGFNDYSNAFQDFAAYFQTQGVAVHAYDQRGFGANPDRGSWPGMARLTGDLERAVDRLRNIYRDVPLYVLGESMGGAVTIVAATGEDALDVDGLILSAPAVWGGQHMNVFYRLTLWFASTLAPGWALSPSGLDIQPSDNIEMLRAIGADPLVIKTTRTSAVAGLVELMDRALASAPKLDQDLLLLIGERDEIIPPGALDDFRSRLQGAAATAISYPEGYHMLLRDLQRARVFEDILAWIRGERPGEISERARLPIDDRVPQETKVSKNNS